MKKKIISISLFVGMSLLANENVNDLELLGKNVLKNNSDIKQLKIELDEIKQKLGISTSELKSGDKISQVINNTNLKIAEKPKVAKVPLLFKAKTNTYIRNSPSEHSAIIKKVQKGQVLKKVVFESKYKIDSWIFVGNGFIKKSLFAEVIDEK